MTVTSPGAENGCMSTSTERMRRLRERKAAALAPVDGPSPLPADEQLAPAVEATVEALKLGPEHAAVAQLALRYASLIDRAEDPAAALRHLGPLLQKVLTELRATPASRPARRPERNTPNRIAQLRAAHAQHPAVRKRGA